QDAHGRKPCVNALPRRVRAHPRACRDTPVRPGAAGTCRAGWAAARPTRRWCAGGLESPAMTWLVTGGAGYIGAHVVKAMTELGAAVAVLDDLSTGERARVPDGVPLVVGSVLDAPLVGKVLGEHGVTGIVHIAAKKAVGESVERPLLYYRENLTGLQTLLDAAVEAGVDKFVFSSSAAVYGMPDV